MPRSYHYGNRFQFFMVHGNAFIRPNYTVLGRVTAGMEVLDAIVAGGIIPGPNGEHDGLPRLPVKIERVTVRH